MPLDVTWSDVMVVYLAYPVLVSFPSSRFVQRLAIENLYMIAALNCSLPTHLIRVACRFHVLQRLRDTARLHCLPSLSPLL